MAIFSSNRADHVFADQFEALDDGYFIYRYNRSGAPIKVSSSERTAFVDGFIKARRRASWGLVVGTIATVALVTAVFGRMDDAGMSRGTYIGAGISVLGFFLFWRWAWKAPVRALADRQCEGPALGKSEAKLAALKRMTWGQLVWSGLVTVIGGAWVSSKFDILSGWNRLWLIGIILFVGLLCWRIWQKWQAERAAQ
ncbi:hypothetical protein D3Y57_07895 [Sphingomonas paeninsulae]|uniref:Uncharacterized protein n=1 Tax=Sphingomonas paeninsulae TaxID=2319844 RepID=A0A494T976_SPHPE|nr:hypothetical protein [Sphingomonas paeninsulae]AYJ85909.1 hypothetical protein D3Y57_07895 [Sphingomonas paeninsulae]